MTLRWIAQVYLIETNQLLVMGDVFGSEVLTGNDLASSIMYFRLSFDYFYNFVVIIDLIDEKCVVVV